MFAVIRYLLVDWLCSWRESPGAALSKAVVAGLLSGVAAMIMLALTVAERSAEASLRAFGDTTVLVSEPGLGPSAGRLHAAIPEALRAVGGGKRRHLGLALDPVEYDGKTVANFFYDPSQLGDWGELAPLLANRPRILFDESLPPKTRLQVLVGKQPVAAVVAERPAWFRRFQDGPCFLQPMIPGDYLRRQMVSDITAVEAAGNATLTGQKAAMLLAQDLRAYQVAENCLGATIRDPKPILDELGHVYAAHAQWRSAILLVIAPLVALVFGTLTVLEFRELRFTAALMRSLGTPAWLLWMRHLLENALLALAAGLLVLVPCGLYAADIFTAMGSPTGSWTAADSLAFFGTDMPVILLALGLGVIVSLIPVAVGLMKPVGRVLP